MLDRFNRNITYLRLSVTDRCNLRCFYCMPEEGIDMLSHKDILSFEEITEFVKVAVRHGINKIRITGGEPLVRKGIVRLASMIASVGGIHDLAMTTNGLLLDQYALPLRKAGIKRLNISLDTVDPEKFSAITRGGDLYKVLTGIKAAQQAGFYPIKINCVVLNSSEEKDASEVSEFCKTNNLEVRFIRMMDLKTGQFSIVEGGSGGDCEKCSRLRLTANGILKPCLFNNLEYSVKILGAEEAIRQAIMNKPECGSVNVLNHFNNIGG